MNNQPTLSTILNQPGTWSSDELSQEHQKAIDTLLYNSFIAMAGWEAEDTSKEDKENALASESKSCRPENNNYSQSICMSWPLSVKHAAKITFAQYKCRTSQSIIYPADKNNLIGISSFLAWGKSRVGLPPPFIARNYKRLSTKSFLLWKMRSPSLDLLLKMQTKIRSSSEETHWARKGI